MKNLLLLHGALGHSSMFNPYLEELSRYFNIHTPLFSGHGNTSLPEGGITIEKYVQEIAEYCETENLDDVYIFGHSMGGYVALCYASENPKNVNSIITLGTKFDWTEEQALKESKLFNPELILEKIPKYAEQLEIQHGFQWKQLLSDIAKMMVCLGKNPPLKDKVLTKIETSVQIMVGDKDNMVSLEESIDVYKKIPNAKLAVLPDTKHPLDKVQPILLFDLMKDFWKLS